MKSLATALLLAAIFGFVSANLNSVVDDEDFFQTPRKTNLRIVSPPQTVAFLNSF